MPRMLWFALGVLAGTTYVAGVIRKGQLERAPGEGALDIEGPELKDQAVDQRALKEQLANRIEEGMIRISGFIEEKAHDLADALRGGALPLDASANTPAQAPAMVGARMAAPIAAGTTAHEVLESPFPQVDPSRPSEPILFDPTHKPPVMLDVTSDQGGMENLR